MGHKVKGRLLHIWIDPEERPNWEICCWKCPEDWDCRRHVWQTWCTRCLTPGKYLDRRNLYQRTIPCWIGRWRNRMFWAVMPLIWRWQYRRENQEFELINIGWSDGRSALATALSQKEKNPVKVAEMIEVLNQKARERWRAFDDR